jgi:hypothetical protein
MEACSYIKPEEGLVLRCRMDFDEEDEDRKKAIQPSLRIQERASRGELTGAILAGILLLYALTEKDVSVCFLAASFLLWQMRVLTVLLRPRLAFFIRNMLQGICISLFIGAILLMF